MPIIILDIIGTHSELLLQLANQNENIVTCYFSLENNHSSGLVRTSLRVKSPWHVLQGHY